MEHTHRFEVVGAQTKMTDIFDFKAPLGFLGQLAEVLFLKVYMTKFLVTKNKELKSVAESDKWQKLLANK